MNVSAGLSDLAVLTHDDCMHRLVRGCVGRVGFVHDERPEVLPVNYAADADGRVVFRAGPNSVLRGVVGQPVVFEVDGADASRRSGWSVCVHGSGLEITDADDPLASQLRKLPVITWAPGRRDRWFAVVPAAVTGRELPISVTGDEGWFPGVPAS